MLYVQNFDKRRRTETSIFISPKRPLRPEVAISETVKPKCLDLFIMTPYREYVHI